MHCQRCGSPISGSRCTDETCPFSDYDQSDPRGWTGHPEPPAAAKVFLDDPFELSFRPPDSVD